MAAHTKNDLYQMQSLPLDAKIRMTARRIDAFIDRKADFDLGDRITCKETKWSIQIDARITEVTETYQKGKETVEATFGDSLPTLVDQIRKVR